MTENLRKYNDIFMQAFNVFEFQLKTLKLKESENWDSVGHIGLISSLEDTFGIEMEPEDMFDISTYEEGLAIKYMTKFQIYQTLLYTKDLAGCLQFPLIHI